MVKLSRLLLKDELKLFENGERKYTLTLFVFWLVSQFWTKLYLNAFFLYIHSNTHTHTHTNSVKHIHSNTFTQICKYI